MISVFEISNIGVVSVYGVSLGMTKTEACNALSKRNIKYKEEERTSPLSIPDIILTISEIKLASELPSCNFELLFRCKGLLTEIKIKGFYLDFEDSEKLYEYFEEKMNVLGFHIKRKGATVKGNSRSCYCTNWIQYADLSIAKHLFGNPNQNPVSLIFRSNSGDSIIAELKRMQSVIPLLGSNSVVKSISNEEKTHNYWKYAAIVLFVLSVTILCFLIKSKQPIREVAQIEKIEKIGQYVYIDYARVLHTQQGCRAVYKDHNMQVVNPVSPEELTEWNLSRVCSQCVTPEQIEELRRIINNN